MIEVLAQDSLTVTVRFPKVMLGNIFNISNFAVQANLKNNIDEDEPTVDELAVLNRKEDYTTYKPVSDLFTKYNYAG